MPTLPVHRGELQGRALGAAVSAWNDEGRAVTGQVGELVITEPMPSMPVHFWGDDEGSADRDAYFSMFPGVWRHGDWIKITSRGTAVIYGRSDSTINRGGIRMGTASIYRAVMDANEIEDAIVVDVPREGTDGWIGLFVVTRDGSSAVDEALHAKLVRAIRERCSPRHVPDEILAIEAVPRTLSGKLPELPLKRILMGMDPDEAVDPASLANPASLECFVRFAESVPPVSFPIESRRDI